MPPLTVAFSTAVWPTLITGLLAEGGFGEIDKEVGGVRVIFAHCSDSSIPSKAWLTFNRSEAP